MRTLAVSCWHNCKVPSKTEMSPILVGVMPDAPYWESIASATTAGDQEQKDDFMCFHSLNACKEF